MLLSIIASYKDPSVAGLSFRRKGPAGAWTTRSSFINFAVRSKNFLSSVDFVSSALAHNLCVVSLDIACESILLTLACADFSGAILPAT